MPSSQNDIGVFAYTLTSRVLPTRTFTITNGVARALPAVPATVDILLLQSDKDIRYNDDGTNSPTGTTGILIQANVPFEYNVADFSLWEGITASGVVGDATVNILGYSYATRQEV